MCHCLLPTSEHRLNNFIGLVSRQEAVQCCKCAPPQKPTRDSGSRTRATSRGPAQQSQIGVPPFTAPPRDQSASLLHRASAWYAADNPLASASLVAWRRSTPAWSLTAGVLRDSATSCRTCADGFSADSFSVGLQVLGVSVSRVFWLGAWRD
jgi:hypothetical protein